MKQNKHKLLQIFMLLFALLFMANAQNVNQEKIYKIYTFEIREQIAKPAWRITREAFKNAEAMGADLIIINMNTYGGLVDIADSIRTKILNSLIPVYVFINDNAASAGALISIAADSIYMRPGGKIGAATVVNQTGEKMPDKYQSYMRATMRATAEAHGKDTIINGNDTTYKWFRDPKIAEAMVDERIYIPGVIDTGKILTFTAEEAFENNYCEGLASSISEIIEKLGIDDYELIEYQPTTIDKLIGLLLNPIAQSLLIMLIIGGLYFELQTPGIGFPLAAAIFGALLYFAPLYLEGMADNWEILIFVIGIILLAVEIFAIPGFGIAGTSGLVLILAGLTMAMVDNFVFESGDVPLVLNTIFRAFMIVIASLFISILASLWVGKKLFTSNLFPHLALNDTQQIKNGYLGVDSKLAMLVEKEGIAHTVLRPSGKIEIYGEIFDAKAEYGFIEKGTRIKVIRYETGQLYVEVL
jgi:membrane-bound serine protease (ClpP class)